MPLKTEQVAKILGCSVGTVLALRKESPTFPAPIEHFKRPYKWRECDIEQYAGQSLSAISSVASR